MTDVKGNKDVLLDALDTWWSEHEGSPDNTSDARLMQALWRYHGDQTEPCPECDGDCGEPCAPCTADAAVAHLEIWIAERNKKLGITTVPIAV